MLEVRTAERNFMELLLSQRILFSLPTKIKTFKPSGVLVAWHGKCSLDESIVIVHAPTISAKPTRSMSTDTAEHTLSAHAALLLLVLNFK